MTLQELLKSFELSDDQVSQVNQSVDEVIERKLAGKDEDIKAIEDELTKTKSDLDSANTELQPVRDNAKKDKLASLMPEDANPDMHEDIVALSGLTDEDDDETIKSKLADTIGSRDYLQVKSTDDKQVAKPTSENTNKAPAPSTDEESEDVLTGVK